MMQNVDQPAFRDAVDRIDRQLSTGSKTMIDLRRSNPDICSTTITKALSYLKSKGKIDCGKWPRSYWKIEGIDGYDPSNPDIPDGQYIEGTQPRIGDL